MGASTPKCLFLTIQSKFHNSIKNESQTKQISYVCITCITERVASRSCARLSSPVSSWCVFPFLVFHVKNGKSLRCERQSLLHIYRQATTYPKKDAFICCQEQILTFFDISKKLAVMCVQRHQANPCFVCKELLLRQAPWEPPTLLSRMQRLQHGGHNMLLCQVTYASSSALLSVVGVVDNFLKTQISPAILHHVTVIRGTVLFLFSCGKLLWSQESHVGSGASKSPHSKR